MHIITLCEQFLPKIKCICVSICTWSSASSVFHSKTQCMWMLSARSQVAASHRVNCSVDLQRIWYDSLFAPQKHTNRPITCATTHLLIKLPQFCVGTILLPWKRIWKWCCSIRVRTCRVIWNTTCKIRVHPGKFGSSFLFAKRHHRKHKPYSNCISTVGAYLFRLLHCKLQFATRLSYFYKKRESEETENDQWMQMRKIASAIHTYCLCEIVIKFTCPRIAPNSLNIFVCVTGRLCRIYICHVIFPIKSAQTILIHSS